MLGWNMRLGRSNRIPWFRRGVFRAGSEISVLALDFANQRYAESEAGKTFGDVLSHSRASAALYQDADGNWQSAGTNEARFGYLFGYGPGLLREEGVSSHNDYARPTAGTLSDHFAAGSAGSETDKGVNRTAIATDSSAPTATLTGGGKVWDLDNSAQADAAWLAWRGNTGGTAKRSIVIEYEHVEGASPASVSLIDFNTSSTLDIGNLGTDSGWQVSRFEDQTPPDTNSLVVVKCPAGTRIRISFVNSQNSRYATSPVDYTGGTGNSRAADFIDSVSTSWYNTSEGTFLLDYYELAPDAANDYNQYYYIGDGGNNNRVQMGREPNDQRIVSRIASGGSSDFGHEILQLTLRPGLNRHAFAYKANDAAIGYNGALMGRDSASVTVPTNISGGFGLGNRPNDTLPATMIIRRLVYFDSRLPNDTLRSITRNAVTPVNADYDGDLGLVLFAGQSNSSGRGTGSASYTNSGAIKMVGNDGNLKAYSDPYDANTDEYFETYLSDGGSAAFGYAGTAIDDLATSPGGSWAAVPANEGGTTISQWDVDFPDSGGLTLMAPRPYVAVQRGLLAQKYGRLRAIVWHQGESDAVAGTAKATYKTTAQALFDELRAIFGIPVVIVSLHQWHSGTGAAESDWTTINTALSELAAANSWTSLVDISDLAGESGDEIHLSNASYITAGQRIADAVEGVL